MKSDCRLIICQNLMKCTTVVAGGEPCNSPVATIQRQNPTSFHALWKVIAKERKGILASRVGPLTRASEAVLDEEGKSIKF